MVRLLAEFAVAGVAAWIIVSQISTNLYVPFLFNTAIPLGPFYYVFAATVIVGFGNAVNLTDGLDGLATMPVVIGGLVVLETAAEIIQVFFFKRTGKRIFRMAPIHHHFEQLGWPESTVVIRFWIVALVLALAGLATLKLRCSPVRPGAANAMRCSGVHARAKRQSARSWRAGRRWSRGIRTRASGRSMGLTM